MSLAQIDRFIGKHPLIAIWFVGVIFLELILRLFWTERSTELFALFFEVNFYAFVIWTLVFSYKLTAYLMSAALPSHNITGMWNGNALHYALQFVIYYGLLYILIRPIVLEMSFELLNWYFRQPLWAPSRFLPLVPLGGLLFLFIHAALDARFGNWLVAAVDSSASHSITAAWRRSSNGALAVFGKLLVVYVACFLLQFAIEQLTIPTINVGAFDENDTSFSTMIRTVSTFVLHFVKTVFSLSIITDAYIAVVRPKPNDVPLL